ncbi:MAG: ATP-dependent sacrificial sulfur transferase LarE [Planctomycetota bacterium]
MNPDLGYRQKIGELQGHLRRLPGAVVAFSGGVDSAMLVHACAHALGDRVLAVTADSPSLPRAELLEALAFAREHRVHHRILETRELQRTGYRANGSDRCYFCKTELFEVMGQELREMTEGGWPVLYGAIADDVQDHRPGSKAAAEHGVLAPLADVGLSKADVRRYSREHGLPTADKPSFACLSSRVPYGTAIDKKMLNQLERAEQVLRDLGYKQFRVRHHGPVARIELLPEELARAVLEDRDRILQGVREAGYAYVSLDLAGYRTGAMNEVLR